MLSSLLSALTAAAGLGLVFAWYQWRYRQIVAESRQRLADIYREYGVKTVPGQPYKMADRDPFDDPLERWRKRRMNRKTKSGGGALPSATPTAL